MGARTELFQPGRLSQGGPSVFSPLFPAFLCALCVSALCFSFSLVAAQTPAADSTAAALPRKPAPHSSPKKKKVAASRRQMAPDPARIKEIQQALAREGIYQGDPTGKWDEASIAAMKQFQDSRGLQPTGKIESLSLQKLGLGSPVAGLAPPYPHPSTAPGSPSSVPPRP